MIAAVTPEELGFDSVRLGRIADVTHRYVDEGEMPGTLVAVVRHGHEVYRDAYGYADVERAVPITDDTVFRLFSMTKPLTSVALLQLVEQGRVLLDDPLSAYLPEFTDPRVWVDGTPERYETRPADREIRIVDLLRHTAGLTYDFLAAHPLDAVYAAHGLAGLGATMDLASFCTTAASLPLLYSPGDRWCYSIATDVAGRVVEVASGRSLAEHVAETITGPLAMTDTGFWARPHQADRLAALYAATPTGPMTLVDDPAVSVLRSPPTMESGGGGMIGTIDDYLRFCRCLLGGGELDGARILGRRTVELATRNHLPGGRTVTEMWFTPLFTEAAMAGTGFGLGFSVLLDAATNGVFATEGEFSWGGAASTAFWIDPVEDLTVVFLTQLLPSSRHRVRRRLRNAVYQALV